MILGQKSQSGCYKFSKTVRGDGINIIAQRERSTFDNRKEGKDGYPRVSVWWSGVKGVPMRWLLGFSWKKRQNHLFISGILHLIFLDQSWIQVTETADSETVDKGRLLCMFACIKFWYWTLQTIKNICKNQSFHGQTLPVYWVKQKYILLNSDWPSN